MIITEERRQQLIRAAKKYISLPHDVCSNGEVVYRSENTEVNTDNLAELAQIALAALEGKHADIVAAAEKLVRCKGRYHSEQNYRALAALFGVTVPDLEPLAGDGWIKCTERFPEIGTKVLIRIPVVDHFNIENGMYKGDGKFIGAWCSTRGEGCAYDVTHWQPLPPEPES